MAPKISIVVPVYNVEPYLEDCINSVLAQTFQDFELILVDDGSPDRCPQLCDEWAQKDNRVRVIHKENGGLSSARNAGIEIARGDYIQFLDSDDTLEPRVFEMCLLLAETNQADVVIFGKRIYRIEQGAITGQTDIAHEARIFSGNAEIAECFWYISDNSMWNYAWDKLFRSTLIRNSNVRFNSDFDRVCEDTVFLLDIFACVNTICVSDYIGYNYLMRDTQSVVRKFVPERYEKYCGKYKKTKELIENTCPSPQNIELLYKQYCLYALWAYENLLNNGCTYNAAERLRHIRNTFKFDDMAISFRGAALEYFDNSGQLKEFSRTSAIALRFIIKKWYFLTWCIHMMSLAKSRLSNK